MKQDSQNLPTLIIGTGLTAMILSRLLKTSLGQVELVDKARGVGGRIATRRAQEGHWDHGLHVFELPAPTLAKLQACGISTHSLRPYGSGSLPLFYSPTGLTAWTKENFQGFAVTKSFHAEKFEPHEEGWKITSKEGNTKVARTVIFTAPVPQALQMLQASPPLNSPLLGQLDLKKVTYAPSLVLLVRLKVKSNVSPTAIEALLGQSPYFEKVQLSFSSPSGEGSICLACFATTALSQSYFEQPEDATQKLLAKPFDEHADLELKEVHLKKWRYARVLQPSALDFADLGHNFYLAGDSFCKGDVQGAIDSAIALASHLTSEKKATCGVVESALPT